MSPDLIDRIRGALLRYVGTLAADDNADAPAELETVAALIRRLPPDPGGAMPEPDAGMRVTMADGRRTTIEQAVPSRHESAAWVVWSRGGIPYLWTPDHIREIRTQDGRVLWRAGEV